MKKQYLVATAILIVVVIWMLIPRNSPSTAEETESSTTTIAAISEQATPSENPDTLTVRARQVPEQTYVERIRVRGRSQAFRMVEVRAEQAGRIVSDPVERGARVEAGDLLCEIAVDDREANLQEAIARRNQARTEYEAAQGLRERSLQSEISVAQLKTALDAAEAAVTRAQLAMDKTRINAPFAGYVETRSVEVGDLLNVGGLCATILDDDPMLLVGLVPEQQVSRVDVGARVQGELLNGRQVSGEVTFLAAAADPVSRSYRMEVTLDPSPERIRSGITAEMLVEAEQIRAHRIPASALSLDDNGTIGVKLIDSDGEVRFQNVSIVGDETDQIDPTVWVSGLSGTVTLITLGQEIVFPGQVVEANFDWARERVGSRVPQP